MPPFPEKGPLRAAMSLGGLVVLLVVVLSSGSNGAFAQIVHHPFAIGGNEGAVGHQNGFGTWILARESGFYRLLTGAVRATRVESSAVFGLIGLSFAYGVFHAAGPGHGKAVIASYMVSNEVALRRGVAIAFLAALLQGGVATAIVGIAALVLHATAARMTAAAEVLEVASYCGIIALGLALVWRKGRAVVAALRPTRVPALLLAGGGESTMLFDGPALRQGSRFRVDDGSADHVHGPDCGHVHMPDPSTLGGARFDWRAATLTVLTAGARPCSGAILVLVFALAQGVFPIGIAATFAMAMGTAVTTAALAIVAVFTKGIAVRLSGFGSDRGLVVGRLVELVAAACVLAFGIALLAATMSGVHPGA